jgi:transposase-like protein
MDYCTTLEQELAIIAAYRQRDATLRKVGAQFSVDASTVREILIRHNVPRRRWGGSRKHPVNADRVLGAAELYGQNLSLDAVARSFGVCRTTAKRWLEENGTQLRNRHDAGVIAHQTRRAQHEADSARQSA